MINWYDNNQDLPVPILSAIMHYALVTIHPFTDGNGRTSRALSTYVLMQHDYDFIFWINIINADLKQIIIFIILMITYF